MRNESNTQLSSGNRKIQDSVFRFVFNAPAEARELAQALGLSVSDTEKLQILTVSRVLTSGIEDDLAFAIVGRAIVMIEAQATSPVNIPYRMLGYCAEAARSYVEKHNTAQEAESFNEYSTTKVKIPPFRLFAICPHMKDAPDEVTLHESGESDLEIRVKIVTEAPQGSLLWQYIQFCRKYKELLKSQCTSKELFERLLKWCKDTNILWKYILERKEEVNVLLNADYVRAKERQADILQGRKEGREEGREEGRKEGRKEGREEGLEIAYSNVEAVYEFANRENHPEWLKDFLKSGMEAEQFIRMKSQSLA